MTNATIHTTTAPAFGAEQVARQWVEAAHLQLKACVAAARGPDSSRLYSSYDERLQNREAAGRHLEEASVQLDRALDAFDGVPASPWQDEMVVLTLRTAETLDLAADLMLETTDQRLTSQVLRAGLELMQELKASFDEMGVTPAPAVQTQSANAAQS